VGPGRRPGQTSEVLVKPGIFAAISCLPILSPPSVLLCLEGRGQVSRQGEGQERLGSGHLCRPLTRCWISGVSVMPLCSLGSCPGLLAGRMCLLTLESAQLLEWACPLLPRCHCPMMGPWKDGDNMSSPGSFHMGVCLSLPT
jgi:hypothetical protein